MLVDYLLAVFEVQQCRCFFAEAQNLSVAVHSPVTEAASKGTGYYYTVFSMTLTDKQL